MIDAGMLETILHDLPREAFRDKLKAALLEEGKTTMTNMQQRFDELMQMQPAAQPVVTEPRFHTITPYLVAPNALELLEFVKQAFGAQETMRSIGSAGGLHAEVRFEDCALMIGGGYDYKGPSKISAWHFYVPDVDAVYQRALELGATSIAPPLDQPYGERSASIKDMAGNVWYIATASGENYRYPDRPVVLPCFNVNGAHRMIEFLERAFGAALLSRHDQPEGIVRYAAIRIGDSTMELSEAHGPYQPMPGMIYLAVEDPDRTFARAVEAGATVLHPPADQPYGARVAGVVDPFGIEWYVSTPLKGKE